MSDPRYKRSTTASRRAESVTNYLFVSIQAKVPNRRGRFNQPSMVKGNTYDLGRNAKKRAERARVKASKAA